VQAKQAPKRALSAPQMSSQSPPGAPDVHQQTRRRHSCATLAHTTQRVQQSGQVLPVGLPAGRPELGRPAPCLPSSRRSSIIRMLLSTSSSASPARVQPGSVLAMNAASVLVPQPQQWRHGALTRDTHMPADSDTAGSAPSMRPAWAPEAASCDLPSRSCLVGSAQTEVAMKAAAPTACVQHARLPGSESAHTQDTQL